MFKNRVPFTLLVCCFPIASFATFRAFLVQKFGNLFPVSPKQFLPLLLMPPHHTHQLINPRLSRYEVYLASCQYRLSHGHSLLPPIQITFTKIKLPATDRSMRRGWLVSRQINEFVCCHVNVYRGLWSVGAGKMGVRGCLFDGSLHLADGAAVTRNPGYVADYLIVVLLSVCTGLRILEVD